jgi:hypothetical protein
MMHGQQNVKYVTCLYFIQEETLIGTENIVMDISSFIYNGQAVQEESPTQKTVW